MPGPRLRARVSVRWLCAILCTALVSWLLIDISPRKAAADRINSLLARREIGGSAKQESELRSLLGWLLPEAGFPHLQFNIDQPHSNGVLNVYLTDPTAEAVTGCGPANAIYDATIDAIFIDKSLFEPEVVFTTPDESPVFMAPAIKVYRALVLLHELGHRALHRAHRAGLPSNQTPTRRLIERQADVFASRALLNAYIDNPRGVFENIGDLEQSFMAARLPPDYARPDPTPSQRWTDPAAYSRSKYAFDLASMCLTVVNHKLFSQDPFTPYYHDEAHDTIIQRSNLFLDSFPGPVSHIAVAALHRAHHYLETCRVAEQALTRVFVAPSPIRSVTFSPTDMYVLTDDGAMYRRAIASIEGARHTGIIALLGPGDKVLQPNVRDIEEISWGQNGCINGTTTHSSYDLIEDRWVKQSASHNDLLQRMTKWAQSDRHGTPSSALYELFQKVDVETLSLDWHDDGKAVATGVFYERNGPDNQALGIFRARIADGMPLEVQLFAKPIKTSDESDMCAIWSNRRLKLIRAQALDEPNGRRRFRLDDITASASKVITDFSLDVYGLEAPFIRLQPLPSGDLLADLVSCGFYVVNPTTGRRQPVFQPGGVWHAASRSGNLLTTYFPLGGYKCYCVRLPRTEEPNT